MTLTGDDAWEFSRREDARIRAEEAEQLAEAKADAERRGKEPFDLEKLDRLCDTSSEGRMAPLEERFAEFERKYYVGFKNVMTLQEFAAKVDELSRW